MSNKKILIAILCLVQLLTYFCGCFGGKSSDHSDGQGHNEGSSVQPFNLDEALEDKNFENFYLLMERATHNMYEWSKGFNNRPMYQTAAIEEVRKKVIKVPKIALNQNYGYREGMQSGVFTIADFIIRYTNGTQDEKIAVLKEIKKMGASFAMRWVFYPPMVYYPKKEDDYESKPYLDLLKQSPKKYDKIIAYLSEK